MNNTAYNAPTVETQPVAAAIVEEPAAVVVTGIKEDVAKTSNESFWRTKVDEYFKYLNGELRFASDEKRTTMVIGFINATGQMLAYKYDEFEDCMLYLIKRMRDTPKVYEDGRFTRFHKGIEKSYALDSINSYNTVMEWATSIAKAYPTRVKRAAQTDKSTLVRNLRNEAKQNLDLFVRKMANYAL